MSMSTIDYAPQHTTACHSSRSSQISGLFRWSFKRHLRGGNTGYDCALGMCLALWSSKVVCDKKYACGLCMILTYINDMQQCILAEAMEVQTNSGFESAMMLLSLRSWHLAMPCTSRFRMWNQRLWLPTFANLSGVFQKLQHCHVDKLTTRSVLNRGILADLTSPASPVS